MPDSQLTRAQRLLERYYEATWDDERAVLAKRLVRLAESGEDATAPRALAYVLNDEKDGEIRLSIVKQLRMAHLVGAIPHLAKTLFDGDPKVRGAAADALSDFGDARDLAGSLLALLDAVSDPVTRASAEAAVRIVTGRAPEKITAAERDRLRAGDHPDTIWAEHFESLP